MSLKTGISIALIKRLQAIPEVYAFVGDRIYPNVNPEGGSKENFIVYSVGNIFREIITGGADGFANINIQLDIYGGASTSFLELDAVLDAITPLFHGFQGRWALSEDDFIDVHKAVLEGYGDDIDKINLEDKRLSVSLKLMV